MKSYSARAALLVSSIIAINTISVTAIAQTASGTMETGSLFTNAPAGGFDMRAKDVRNIVMQFAACSYRRSPGRVAKLLAMPIGSPDYRHMLDTVAVDDCLGGGTLSFNFLLLRGALFEQLYRHDFNRAGPTDVSKAPAVDYMAGYQRPLPAEAANGIALARFGDCVARADGTDAKQLVLSMPDSSYETGAFSGLSSHLGPCVPAGQQVRFSKSMLRTAIAEGFYRLSVAQQGRTGIN